MSNSSHDWPQWDWDDFCGPGGLVVWSSVHHDMGVCFQNLCLQFPTLVLLAVFSSYYIGIRMYWISTGRQDFFWALIARGLATFLMAVSPILKICLAIAISPKSLYPVDYLLACVETVTWFIHLCFIFTLKDRVRCSLRGPVSLCILWTLTFALAIVSVRSHYIVFKNIVDEKLTLFVSQCYGFSISFCILQCIYLLTLIPADKSVTELSVNNVPSSTERDGLLGSSRLSTFSRFHEEQDPQYLGVAKENAPFLSRLLFHWVSPMMDKGTEGKLKQPDDVFDLPVNLTPAVLSHQFEAMMFSPNSSYETTENNEITFKNPTLLQALHKCFGLQFYGIGILKLLSDLAGFCGPLLLNRLVSFIENREENIQDGVLYAAGLFSTTLISAFCLTHFNFFMAEVGLKIRAAIVTIVYRKTLTITSISLSEFSVGEVMNFMSTDTDRIVNSCPSFHAFWSIPFQIAVTLYLLYMQVGLAFLAGVGFTILLIPINKYIANKIAELSTKMMSYKDDRVKLMAEVLRGIRAIKLHVWEHYFIDCVDKYREKELKYLKGRKYLDALCVYFWATTPVLISILTFTTYILLGNSLTAATVFTSMALLNMLIAPLNAFPWVLNGLMEAWVSLKRIQKLLQLPDLDLKKYYTSMPSDESELALLIKGGIFSWKLPTEDEGTSPNAVLSNIDLIIRKGDLVGVMGRVGTGKSSLLHALLAELNKTAGTVSLSNLDVGFGLVAQQAWLQRGTVRENILFGKSYDHSKYKAVVEACCLSEDFDLLPHGDLTGVGEGGTTLSGGQKARVCLARAVYQDKNVYLLDDILSAVDVHVAHHIFQHCIKGLLHDKTRVVCTHHPQYLLSADQVVVLKDGTVHQHGKPDVILADYDEFLSSSECETEAKKVMDMEEVDKKVEPDAMSVGGDSILEDEGKETGTVHFNVYLSYWKAVGHLLGFSILLSLVLMQLSRNLTDWWLSFWVSNTVPSTNTTHFGFRILEDQNTTSYYLTVYGVLAALNSIFTLFRAFLFAYGGIHAADIVHKSLLNSIINARILFFDISPMGRILNRFSSDTYTIDDTLPFITNILLAQFFSVIGTIVIVIYGLPWLILVLAPLIPVYYWLQNHYRLTSRELKRLSSVTLSPVYSHFNETLTGLTTIRAFRATQRFKRENEEYLEMNLKCQYSSQAAAQWLGLRLQFIGVTTVTGICVIAVLQHQFDVADAGLIGLAISYALSITGILNGLVNAFTETEKEMIAVERVMQYVKEVDSEPLEGIAAPPYAWPGQGVVIFNDVVLKYREHLSPSLRGVSFETRPAEKIGIVGRTGAGKSSLFVALFRMSEVTSGEIYIDTVNIAHIGLTGLRARLAIIPQDPFLFSGTVRENLDPLEEYRDPELWDALQRCHLSATIKKMGGLKSQVGPGGSNFSAGQKQLLCLARAVLHNCKILCIDEATANVDQETDRHIQRTLRFSFRQSTVLTIAHRVSTVMDSDRVLVMGDGVILEFDAPDVLLEDKTSYFYKLASQEFQ